MQGAVEYIMPVEVLADRYTEIPVSGDKAHSSVSIYPPLYFYFFLIRGVNENCPNGYWERYTSHYISSLSLTSV